MLVTKFGTLRFKGLKSLPQMLSKIWMIIEKRTMYLIIYEWEQLSVNKNYYCREDDDGKRKMEKKKVGGTQQEKPPPPAGAEEDKENDNEVCSL